MAPSSDTNEHPSDREGRRHLDEISDPEDVVNEEEWFFGIRRTIRRTNWLYRDDALTQSMIREMADQFLCSLLLLESSLYILVCIVFLLARLRQLPRMTADYFFHSKIILILTELFSWMLCRGYRLILDVEDSIYFIRRRERFTPEIKRTISSLSPSEAYDYTGFSKRNLRKLFRHLRFPPLFECGGCVFTGEEALIMYLHQLRHGYSYTTMARDTFGGDPRRITYMVRASVYHLYNNFYHKISGKSMSMWTRWIDIFRYVIWLRLVSGGVIEVMEEVEDGWTFVNHIQVAALLIPFALFRPFGFLDDFGVPTARPGDSPTRRFGFVQDIQRAFYR